MRFSRAFEGEKMIFPNGAYIATLLSSASLATVNVREVNSLHTIRELTLPRSFVGPVVSFQWSQSSKLVLVASTDEIHVFSVLEEEGSFNANIRNPAPPAAKLVYVGFGASDTDVCVCASLGLKFAVFNLASSKAVEVANPKFHTAASVRKGFCFRPKSQHLTVITRTSGKDMISIHHPKTKELQRSWSPDTIDAQGVVWSPDGRWLVTWESAAHGHKVLFYTPDGNLFKTWSGPQPLVPADADIPLGPGVRLLDFSADATNLVIGDSSRRICIINMTSVTESLRLLHPNTIVSTDTLQVWQEQFSSSGHHFVRALQTIIPPNAQQRGIGPFPSGIASASFDPTSTLLATRLEEAPSTLWVWEIASAELRAALLFHGNVSQVIWHPTIRETMLVICEGDAYNSLVFSWDPLSEGPQTIDLSERLPNGKVQATWLSLHSLEPGALFASDNRNYLLASLAENDDETVPWPADSENSNFSDVTDHSMSANAYDDEASQLDDTFCFKKT
ncbi:hypothetical protein N0V82_000352 [Gnomoniopsis sp. IMI 355080]|nr:hypothetical protein N0V82_000352 [Gnomoniopsis sp. IMI 355080]